MWDWENPPVPIRRIEVPNSGFMRGQPTNCYVLGEDSVVIVDPGSAPGIDLVPQKLEEFGSPDVQAIFLTHAHPDHSIAGPELRRILDAPLMLHADNDPILREHISWDDVDIQTDPSSPLNVEGIQYQMIMTPGHAPGHVALFEGTSRAFIAGDLVSGNGTIGISPPNGSMIVYLDSLRRAKSLEPSVLLPGHGPQMDDAQEVFEFYLERRAEREQEILELVENGGKTIEEMLPILYPDLLEEYSRPALNTIYAHLLKLEHEGRVRGSGGDLRNGRWVAR